MNALFSILWDICLPISALAGAGWLLDRKFRLDLSTLVRLNLYLFVPCFIFVKVAKAPLAGPEAAKVVGFTLAMIALCGVAASLFAKFRRSTPAERTGLQLATMFYNCGNYGIPLTALAFGEMGPQIQVFVLMTMNISTFSVGLALASRNGDTPARTLRERAKSFLPMLRQPSIYAIALGLTVRGFELPVERLTPLWTPLTYIAAGLVPIALITLGVQMSKTRPPSLRGNLGGALALRLLLSPVIAFGLGHAFGFSPEVIAILTLGAGAPTAVNTALLAHEFKGDGAFATAAVFYSTIASIVTATLTLGILRAFFLEG